MGDVYLSSDFMLNLPNTLTLFRICLIPLIVILLLTSYEGNEVLLLALFIFTALTDTLDGFLARRWNQITVFGELIDPLADKLLIASMFICMVELGKVPAWMVIVILAREFAVTGLRSIAASRGIRTAASVWGKIKMDSQAVTIGILILGERILGRFYILARIGLWVVIGTALASGLFYFVKYGPKVLSENEPKTSA